MHLEGGLRALGAARSRQGKWLPLGHAKAACARWGAIAPPWAVRPTSQLEESYAGNVTYEAGSSILRTAKPFLLYIHARILAAR